MISIISLGSYLLSNGGSNIVHRGVPAIIYGSTEPFSLSPSQLLLSPVSDIIYFGRCVTTSSREEIMTGSELVLPGGELVAPENFASLLDLMRRIAKVFQSNYDTFHSMMEFSSGTDIPGAGSQMFQTIAANSELVLALPGFLGAGG